MIGVQRGGGGGEEENAKGGKKNLLPTGRWLCACVSMCGLCQGPTQVADLQLNTGKRGGCRLNPEATLREMSYIPPPF